MVAQAWVAAHPEWLLIDVEEVGQMLRRILGPFEPVDDFQDYAAWAPLVIHTVRELHAQTGRPLVLPICISSRSRFEHIRTELLAFAPFCRCYCLVADPETIRRRLAARGDGPGSWPELRVDSLCQRFATGDWGTSIDASQPVDVILEILARSSTVT